MDKGKIELTNNWLRLDTAIPFASGVQYELQNVGNNNVIFYDGLDTPEGFAGSVLPPDKIAIYEVGSGILWARSLGKAGQLYVVDSL